jgi:hypothetical protein
MSDIIKRRRPRREQAAPETIARLFKIANEAAEHALLADGPVTPDADLLDKAAQALHLISQASQLAEKRAELLRSPRPDRSGWAILTGTVDPKEARTLVKADLLWEERAALIKRAMPIMRAIAKQPAKTAAGVYAKALLVRGSQTGAQALAQSLSRDLVSNPVLRARLWSAEALQ